jgi:hypothetical protein
MSATLAVQTKKYGAITSFDLLHERRLIASLIKEKANLVDYSHQRVFENLDAAVEFYLSEVTSSSNLDKVRGSQLRWSNWRISKLLSPILSIFIRL